MRQMLILLSAFSFLSLPVFAQTVKDNIDKHAKNPTTAENAAKADVYIHRNKIMNDNVPIKKSSAQVITGSKKKEKQRNRKTKK